MNPPNRPLDPRRKLELDWSGLDWTRWRREKVVAILTLRVRRRSDGGFSFRFHFHFSLLRTPYDFLVLLSSLSTPRSEKLPTWSGWIWMSTAGWMDVWMNGWTCPMPIMSCRRARVVDPTQLEMNRIAVNIQLQSIYCCCLSCWTCKTLIIVEVGRSDYTKLPVWPS